MPYSKLENARLATQDFPSDLPVIKVNLLFAQNLIILVPFPSNHHHIARLRPAQCEANRFAPVRLDSIPANTVNFRRVSFEFGDSGFLHARLDLLENTTGIL